MDYRNLRFMGFYVFDDNGHQSALAAVRHEMKEREPQRDGSNLYQPDGNFKTAVMRFSDDFKKYGDVLLERAQKGEALETIEIRTLDRAERLYAEAVGQSSIKVPFRLANLDEGIAMHGKGNGLSLTERVKRAAGHEESSGMRSAVTAVHRSRDL